MHPVSFRCLALALPLLLARAPFAQEVEPDRTIPSPDSTDFIAFGAWVAAIGDADGDAQRDLVVAAPRASTTVYQDGRVYLMSSTGAVISQIESPQPIRDGAFGSAAAFVGDLNGDNRREAAVGAFFEGPPTGGGGTSNGAGRAYVFAGGSGTLLFQLLSPAPVAYGYFGYSVAGPGDVTGDGVPDVAVGALRETSAFLRGGNVHVYSGADGALVRTLVSPSATQDGAFGWRVEPAGDLTGDGVGDLLVGASQEFASDESGAGRVHLFSGADGAWVRAFDPPEGDTFLFGRVFELVGDLDGDGTPDVAVAATGSFPNGRVFVYSGATGVLFRTFVSAMTESVDGQFGSAIMPAGDVDFDGVPDVLVGAPFENGRGTEGVRAGRVYLLSGATGEVLLLLTSPNPILNGAFGASIDWADIDGDGEPDPVVGAWRENSGVGGETAGGRVYLYTSTALRGVLIPTAPEPGAPAAGLAFEAPRPNPTGGTTRLAFTLAAAGAVRLAVYDALGREVAVLADGPRAAGRHEAVLDAARLAPGVYVARLTAGGRSVARRLVVAP